MRVLVAGIGNPWASDDGVGPEVVRRVQARWTDWPGAPVVAFLALSQPDVALLDALAGCDGLVVVDAIFSGAVPGALTRISWQPGALASRGVERASSHGFGVGELLELAARLGRAPVHVELWGVEAASTAPGEGLSPAVAARVDDIAEQLLHDLRNLTKT